MVEDKDAALYKQATERIDDMIEEVFQLCDDLANENHYERDWVLNRFRERFNAARRK